MSVQSWAKKWDHRLDVADVFHNDDLTTSQKAAKIVERIRLAPFWDADDFELVAITEEMEGVESTTDFNYVWNDFYDWCDTGKSVWVVTW